MGGRVLFLLVDVGGVLEFVELLDVGRHVNQVHRASQEQRLERDAGGLERRARLHPDFVRRRDGAIGGRAGCQEALAVGNDELALGLEAQERLSQFLGARGAQVDLGGAHEDAFDVGIIHRGIEAQQNLDERKLGKQGADRVAGRLIRVTVAEVELQHGVAYRRRLPRRQEERSGVRWNQDKEDDQGGETAEESEKESPH